MEGPGVLLIAENLQGFVGAALVSVCGNTRYLEEFERLEGSTLSRIVTFGKRLYLVFSTGIISVHFLMYGRYHTGEDVADPVRLGLRFDRGTLGFYNASVHFLRDMPAFDSRIDIMSPAWNGDLVYDRIRNSGDLICDLLLDQTVFAGVGNIIKNEALARAGIHPLSVTGSIPQPVQKDLIEETRAFSLLFYREKKEGRNIRDSCRVYGKRTCPSGKKVAQARMGRSNRLTYVCEDSQVRHAPGAGIADGG